MDLFVLGCPEDEVAPDEWFEQGRAGTGYRQSVVPTDNVNTHCRPRLFDESLDNEPNTD
jgi:hypothetical protein